MADNNKTGLSRSTTRLRVCAVALVLMLCLGALAIGGGLAATAWVTQGGLSRATPVLAASRPAVVPTVIPSAATPPPQCPAPAGFSATGVQVSLVRTAAAGPVVSFGLPLPPGVLTDAATLRAVSAGQPVPATVKVLLGSYGPAGTLTGLRAVLVQLPASALHGDCTVIDVSWQGGTTTRVGDTRPYTEVSVTAQEIADTAERTIQLQGGAAALVETTRKPRVLFTGKEPAVLATFPAGYLAATGILGHQLAASQVGPDLAGLKYITDQLTPFGLSAMYQERYALNPRSVVGPQDLSADVTGYEAWLYDRCATFMLFATHTGDLRFLREAFRSCSFYASKIELNGENRGIFTVKPEPDPKYSHLRGLYAYYALTGDEAALAAGTAIAELWLGDQFFSGPYRAGHLLGPDKLWTERLLGTSLEGLYFGHLLTGKPEYLTATTEMVNTAYRHITGDAAVLAQINPGSTPFPPQNCFIHSAEQAAEGDLDQPWCSGWMPALVIEPLLAYQDQTGDARVDEIFIRLTRYLRDTGTSYFNGNLQSDDFLHPSVAYDPNAAPDEQRLLVPLYGAGLDRNGKRQNYGEYDDVQHCLDATALTAAGLRALRRSGGYDQNPIGPFPSEGESFLALHHELAYCAYATFLDQTRPHRDPATFTSDQLTPGLGNPAAFILDNKIGFPSHNVDPQRKLSWWFNEALGEFALLKEAGVSIPALRPGAIQP